jgi:hypothetical protein
MSRPNLSGATDNVIPLFILKYFFFHFAFNYLKAHRMVLKSLRKGTGFTLFFFENGLLSKGN